ncbi:hypothetical protein H17ap60334_07378 [Thermosipho africanus H17ap60334]|uniref:hypothetical protein n=1 Tax=Thermosipho africanus TaxID=2421 RepID=UPI00028C744F|nr:hypothetical protein [Thermosipho africanus]EKF49124.1 hypothetical protein H17ap60334_07378 [Thermosipho africanus H17ap60334]
MHKKIDIFQLAKLQALLFFPIGILSGFIYSIGGLIYDLLKTGSVNLGSFLAFFAIIGMPVLFYVIGFILGIVEGFMFNTFLVRFLDKIYKIKF